MIILDRNDWGADTSKPRLGHGILPKLRTEVFIHHTAIAGSSWSNLDQVMQQMKSLQTIRPDLGEDVPYNFVAFCMTDGELVLCEGRGLWRTGAHTKGHNRSSIGIAFHGDFENYTPPKELDSNLAELGQWLSTVTILEGFENLGSVSPDAREVFGHYEVKSTLCPGKHLKERLHLIRFLGAA